MELNVRQMTHLQGGIERAEKNEAEYDKMNEALDAEEAKVQAMLAKVVAQNQILETMNQDEERKRMEQEQLMRCPPPPQEILSSSQNVRPGSLMGPPPIPRPAAAGGTQQQQRPNVTRLWDKVEIGKEGEEEWNRNEYFSFADRVSVLDETTIRDYDDEVIGQCTGHISRSFIIGE